MTEHTDNRRQQRATRCVFFIAGLGMAAWAPLIPFAQSHLAINAGTLGLLLFCIAAGSMLMMPFTGALIARLGCRTLILLCGVGLACCLALLMHITTLHVMGFSLLLFGAFNGLLDVTMNYQAVIVERASGDSKMSGFHGFYSLGSIAGAGAVSLMLWFGVPAQWVLIPVALAILRLLISGAPALLTPRNAQEPPAPGALKALAHRKVLLIAVLCFILFLTEGAMLDWSAVFMSTERDIPLHLAGWSFTLYSIAVATLRLFGDRLITRYGNVNILMYSGLVATAGLTLVTFSDWMPAAFAGFVIVGIGLANIIPILFTAAGNQPDISAHVALPAVTLCGYSGLLTGPALIGFSAQLTSLSATFSAGIILLLIVTFTARLSLHRQ
ncbi:MFS transporter [Enterobacterales bacterium CwR94]|nr:MFS transporter [Enterobacterales bacterium CwR94]